MLKDENPPRERASRRVHSKSIERRKRILDAAARALAEQGYSEAKLSDIAQEAGTHAGSLYYYFPSREDLVKEVLLTSLDRISKFSAAVEKEFEQLSPLEQVLAFVRMVIDGSLAPDDFYFRAYLRNGNQVPESIHKVIRTRRHKVRQTLAELLTKAKAKGEIPDSVDTFLAAQFIIGATQWVGMWYEPSGPYSADTISEHFVNLVLRGVLGEVGEEMPSPTPKPDVIPRKRRGLQKS